MAKSNWGITSGFIGKLGKLSSLLYDAIYEGYRREANENKSTQSGLFIKYNQSAISGTKFRM